MTCRQSPNHPCAAVGYMNKDTNEELYTMVAPAFQNVGKTTYSLYDLKGGGYEASKPNTAAKPRYTGGCQPGDFEVRVLKNDGNVDTTLPGGGMYFWADAKTGFVSNPTTYGPGWFTYDSSSGEFVEMAKEQMEAIRFDLGQAFWVAAGSMTLVSSGEVSKNDLEVDSNDDLYTAIGNGIPVDMTLADLTGGGYEASKPNTAAKPRYTGGCQPGDFEVRILKNDGNVDTSLPGGGMYFWADAKTGFVSNPTTYGPGWFTYDSSSGDFTAMTKEQMEAVKIPAGQGLWVKAATMTLIFPSPLADHEAK